MILLETVLLQAPVQPTLYEAQHYTQYMLKDWCVYVPVWMSTGWLVLHVTVHSLFLSHHVRYVMQISQAVQLLCALSMPIGKALFTQCVFQDTLMTSSIRLGIVNSLWSAYAGIIFHGRHYWILYVWVSSSSPYRMHKRVTSYSFEQCMRNCWLTTLLQQALVVPVIL